MSTTELPDASTRLGRAVRATTSVAGVAAQHLEEHGERNWLRDVILGGQDGLVNMLGIVLGVTAAGGSIGVLVVTGIAAAITESISMGAVGYTSAVSERDYYRAARAREAREVETIPEVEREEIRLIFAAKGFEGELLERVVDTITANRERWIETMMDEELHLRAVDRSDILGSAAVIGVATFIGHLVPLLPFVVLPGTPALALAFVASAFVLFGVGAYSSLTLIGDWRRTGLQLVGIGLGAALLGYLVSGLVRLTFR